MKVGILRIPGIMFGDARIFPKKSKLHVVRGEPSSAVAWVIFIVFRHYESAWWMVLLLTWVCKFFEQVWCSWYPFKKTMHMSMIRSDWISLIQSDELKSFSAAWYDLRSRLPQAHFSTDRGSFLSLVIKWRKEFSNSAGGENDPSGIL